MAVVEGTARVNLDGDEAAKKLEQLRSKAQLLNDQIVEVGESSEKSDKKAKKQLTALKKSYKEVTLQIKDAEKQTLIYDKVLKNLSGASIKELTSASRILSAEMRDLGRDTDEYKQKAGNLTKVKTELAKVRAETAAVKKETQSLTGKAVDGFNRFAGAVMAATAVITGLVLGLRKMSDVIVEWEKSFTNVLTLLSDDDVEQFGESLEEGSIKLIKMGFAADDVNKSLFDMISSGVSAGDAISQLEDSAELAIGGVTKLSVAVDGQTTVMNAYNLASSESTKVTSAFFAAQKAGKTTVEELAAGIGKVVPVAKNLGINYKEVLAAIARMAKGGISTQESFTKLNSLFSALVNPSKEAARALEEFNVPIGVSEIKSAGLTKTLEALNDMIEQNPDAVVTAIPPIEALTGVFALSGEALDDYKLILEDVNNDYGEHSSLSKAFQRQQLTSAQMIAKAKGQITALTLSMRDGLKPIISEVMSLVGSFSSRLTKFMSANSGILDFIKNLVKESASLADIYKTIASEIIELFKAFGQLFSVFGKAKGEVSGLTIIFKIFKGAILLITAPLRFLVFLTTLITKGFALLYNGVEDLTGIFDKIGKGFTWFVEKITVMRDAIVELYDDITDAATKSGKAIQESTEQTIRITRMSYQERKKMADKAAKEAEKQRLLELAKAKAAAKAKEDLNDLIRSMNLQLLEDQRKKALEEELIWEEKEEKKIKSSTASAKQRNEALEVLAKLHRKKITTINDKFDTEIENRYKSVISFQKQQNALLENDAEEIKAREIQAIEEKFNKQIQIATDEATKNHALSAQFAQKAIELEQQKTDAINAYNEQKEIEHSERIKAIREEYNLLTDEDHYNDEIAKLDAYHNQELISDEDYLKAKAEIEDYYQNLQEQKEIDAYKKKLARYQEGINKQQAITSAFSDFFSESKQRELDAAGDNEEEKLQIKKRYADREMLITISNIAASTALGIMKAFELGPIAGGIAATLITAKGAVQTAAAVEERNRIKGLETGGLFNVTRTDGQQFQASYNPDARGYISRPTVLVGEHNRAEYVVPNEGLQNPSLRGLIRTVESARQNGNLRNFNFDRAIEGTRIRGYEEGGFIQSANNSGDTATQSNSDDLIIQLISETKALRSELNSWATSLKVYLPYSEIEFAQESINKIKAEVTTDA